MRGNAKIINSDRDAKSVGLTYEQAVAAATITVRYDDAQYPDNYDKSLKEGDEGYVEPIWRFEEEIDNSVLERFGFVSNEA
ncbi:hypothetical protein ACPF4W_003213 [Vibrio cholerae]|uniref:hypothetical protein n=1 Tax=Vibrio TaxID=662 RepID=UPI00021AA5EA|nr:MULTISPECIES: hypothetical protein [Vibrio]EGS66985.1 hypothetical protein VCHE09_3165 [Vibrio paracholerae HE-09]MBW5417196.1 hypothetical protein [Vibrio cholerae]